MGSAIIVLEELVGLDSGRFLRIACPEQHFPTFVHINWREPSEKKCSGIDFAFGKYEPFDMQLFVLPVSIKKDFTAYDLAMPDEVKGFALMLRIRDADPYLYLRGLSQRPEWGGLAWIKQHAQPFVVVLFYNAALTLDLNLVETILSLDKQMAALVVSFSPDNKNVDNKTVTEALSLLAEKIKARS